MLTPASRAAVPPFHVMDLLAAASARARSHGDLLNLVAGQPSTPAPVAVREAAKRALDEHVLGYTVAVGVPGGRSARACAPPRWRWAFPSCARRSPAITSGCTGSRSILRT